VIYVSDNGRGIPESKFSDVFFPFKRLDHRSVPGSGMGLTIVQQILRAHSGSIKVKKSSPEGTTFEIRLPQFIKKDN
jgi:signal transduction histidine kinase